MHISCSYHMSYVITFDIWEVRILSLCLKKCDLANVGKKEKCEMYFFNCSTFAYILFVTHLARAE